MRPIVVLVTDPAFGDDVIVHCVEAAAAALPPGALCVQLRDKRRPIVSLRQLAWRLRLGTRGFGASLVVNGDARLARDVGADGVHLGRGAGGAGAARAVLGRPAWVSVAAHSDEDVRRASDDGANAVLVSPVFATRPPSASGPGKVPRGLGAIRTARAVAPPALSIYALGGVTADGAGACAAAGADGVAVMRALLASAAPARAARAIHDAFVRRW
jgi:thiamine-phosphate diphosphorylase